MFLSAAAITCFTSNGELRTAAALYANGTTPTSNLSTTYGYPISEWCVDQITDFSSVFANLTTFNDPITNWNTSNAVSMKAMFYGATAYNQPLALDTSKVTTMESMFENAVNFAQDLTSFRTSQVTTMARMFQKAISFNGDVSSFDVSNVVRMDGMFSGASQFNQPSVTGWNVSRCTNFDETFKDALSFDQDLSKWDVSSATSMSGMFFTALSFSQDLCDWGSLLLNTTTVTSMFDLSNCPQTVDPNLTSSPPGPFCFTCTAPAPTVSTAVPSTSPSGVQPSISPSEILAPSFGPSFLSIPSIEPSVLVPTTAAPTRRPSNESMPSASPNGSHGDGSGTRQCFRRLQSQCNCGLVDLGSDCARNESQQCASPPSDDRRVFLRTVRTDKLNQTRGDWGGIFVGFRNQAKQVHDECLG